MKEQSLTLQDTTIRQQCKHLRMPTIGSQFRKLAEQITKVLVARQIEIEENVSARSARLREDAEARNSALLGKIRKFFAL